MTTPPKSTSQSQVPEPEETPVAKAGTPGVVTTSTPVVGDPDLKKPELFEELVARTGLKKRDAKPLAEALLAILGEAVAKGRGIDLQPFGKLRVVRCVEKPNVRVSTCKLRQRGGEFADVPLAEMGEDE